MPAEDPEVATSAPRSARSDRANPIWHSRGRQLLVLLGLTGFAISQPLLSILGDEPAVVAFHGVEGTELALFALGVAFVPPLILWGGSVLLQLLSRVAGRAVHLGLVAVLVAAFLVQVVKGPLAPVVAVLAALAGGAAFALAYTRRGGVARWASYTAILPALAVGTFLFTSPTSALLSSPSTAPEADGGTAPSVVMIVLDELPTRSLLDDAGGIDPTRFPNLAAFAEGSTWYRHHTSQVSMTQSALPSLVTGKVPDVKEPLFTNYPDNLFTLLAPTHEMEVFETATHLCPYEQCVATGPDNEEITTGPGVRELVDVTRDLWFERLRLDDSGAPALDDFVEEVSSSPSEPPLTSASATDPPPQGGFAPSDEQLQARSVRAEAFASSFDVTKGPALYFLHLLLPHQPWRHEADGALYAETDQFGYTLPDADRRNQYSWSPWIGAVSEQRHLLQMQYTDQVLGDVLGAVEDSGLYDSSLVIVTADHGVSFETDQPSRKITEDTIDALAYTPLLVKQPGQKEGSIDDSNVLALDVLPTIAEAVDVDIPWEVDGTPVGSDAALARGARKTAYDIQGLGDMRLVGTFEYDDDEVFPTVADGWIGLLPDPEDPLSGLNELLGIHDLLGVSLDDLTGGTAPTSTAHLFYLDEIERPPGVPITYISGAIDEPSEDGIGLLVVNGVVVGGSQLSTDSSGSDGRLQFLIPTDVLEQTNEVRVAVLVDGEVRELELT